MANGMGSLYIGASGLQNSQNALNTTANNLANVDTPGYVRQQVLFEDKNYVTVDKNTAFSYQQIGLGVSIGDVVHSRDAFLDRYFREAAGQQAFYDTTYTTVCEVEDLFQELEGETFQDVLKEFWVSFEELAKQPDSPVQQNLVIQKATLFLERSQAIYQQLKDYQRNMNLQIENKVERINELGKEIQELNIKIMATEAGNVETAMTLRDRRDYLLDELGSLAKISTKELPEGVVKVRIEGVDFVDGVRVYEMGLEKDKITGFETPYWPHLSDEDKGKYYHVFDFSNGVSNANSTDVGSLKALVLARGDHYATYNDMEGLNSIEYYNTLQQSAVLNAEAQLDQLAHAIVTAINDLLCPNTTASFVGMDGKKYDNVQVWDEKAGAYGNDNVKPGHELFVRRGCERYTEVTAKDGTIYYVYNEEYDKEYCKTHPNAKEDLSTQYTTFNLTVNETLLQEECLLPFKKINGDTDFAMAAKMRDVWDKDLLKLTPDDPDACSFKEYYQRMMDGYADRGNVYSSKATALAGSVQSIDNQRQQVIGVSSDEELTNMIKYQNAYNAASRFINVVSEMLEHIIMRLGS